MSTMEVTEEEMIQVVADENFEKGLSKGLSQGLSKGLSQGAEKLLIKQIIGKIAKGKDVYSIASDLDEEVEAVQEIFDIALSFKPEYDVDQIYEVIQKNRESEKR